MSNFRKALFCGLAAACTAASALACGHPPTPPPPPPAPPVVCCRIVAWYKDPICPGRQVLIFCYFRQDGLPLYVSNPMPLPASQQCACGLSALPPIPGVADGGIAFGPVGDPALSCGRFPQDVPGYGPFTPEKNPQVSAQVDSFFDIFYEVAQIPRPNPTECPTVSTTLQFRGGPNQAIPPGITFAIYRKIVIPAGFNPALLCGGPAGGSDLSAVGLFLVDNGVVLAEPPAAGLPPIPIGQFQQNPGASAFYKVKCVPFDLTALCPPPCGSDVNGDGVTDFDDIVAILSNWLALCP